MLDPAIADALRKHPGGKSVMTQSWANLTFIHFAIDPELVQASLPAGLTVDTFPDASGEERAWIGLVPFEIQKLSFGGKLGFPSASHFLETNVRTYVHRDGKEPGVWFYSLDAASRLACQGARTWFGLPYWYARMSYLESGEIRQYQGTRFASPQPKYNIEVKVGEPISAPSPGTLEFYLVERYLLYSQHRSRLWSGRVFHEPYRLRQAELIALNDELVSLSGIPVEIPSSIIFSAGVDVEVFPLV